MNYSWKNPKPEKTAVVIRYGAWGDCLQSASVLPGLKRQGFYTIFICTPRGLDAIKHDPHIDKIIIQNEDLVPNHQLTDYFNYLKTRYTKVINMCETVEGIVLPIASRAHFHWPKEARHMVCNQNYVEMQHKIAEVPYDKPEIRFYETEEERKWALQEKSKSNGKVIAWVLAGSGVHKLWPHIDDVISKLLEETDSTIVLIGSPTETKLQGDWDHPRVWRKAGQWSIRQTMTFCKYADVVVGPETGILSAVSMEENPKVLILSHSTVENLSRDWVNTISLHADVECYPCHRLHLEGWKYCVRHPQGTAMCQMMLPPEKVGKAVLKALNEDQRIAA